MEFHPHTPAVSFYVRALTHDADTNRIVLDTAQVVIRFYIMKRGQTNDFTNSQKVFNSPEIHSAFIQ